MFHNLILISASDIIYFTSSIPDKILCLQSIVLTSMSDALEPSSISLTLRKLRTIPETKRNSSDMTYNLKDM